LYPLDGSGEKIEPSVNFPALEQQILAYWQSDDTFQKSIDCREAGTDGANEFVFYDGPPFANGLPHYGHLLTGYVKDVIPRYKTMRGRRVERRFGWDTHGLPAELEAERELGITNKNEIDAMGVQEFNEACRRSVLKYTSEWEDYVNRQARWVDFQNDYKTLDINYMESVIWAFKELYKKDLVYEGYKVLPYCWHDQTPLSNHELRMDAEVYKDRTDQSVTVGVRLKEPFENEIALIWTTTPWTLPSNFAIAVGHDIEYDCVVPSEGNFKGQHLLIAKERVSAYKKELGENPEVIATFPGKKLIGTRYYPMFDYYNSPQQLEKLGDNAWTIVEGDHVTTENGTGLVHMAPYGEEDMVILQREEIIPVAPVDEAGCFTDTVTDYKGQFIFDANKQILADFREVTGPFARIDENKRPILIRQESTTHSYPHCWRCRNPLIYKPVSSWFVKVTKIKERMLELNKNINWTPEKVKDGQFGKWLENAIDWSISRNRYWGSPIPVWVSDNPKYPRVDVYGSIAELEADFGVKVTDLHRPFIDTLTRPNPDDPSGKSQMHRIEDVFDCWFESGSMSFAQVHYPFENAEWFESHFPGDFIVEYIGQTRGWFYTMHIMATALFDCNAFKNVMCHGIVLGDDGQKMSKSLRNYPDVDEVFKRDGSDAMRWFLMSSSILRGGNIKVTEEAIRDATRRVLIPLWSSYYFFVLYTNASNNSAGYTARVLRARELDSLPELDKYILAKTRTLVTDTETSMESYDIAGACMHIEAFLDVLTNWYIRNSRDRFWDEDENAFNTLYTVFRVLLRVMAPLAPLVTEKIWLGLGGKESLHLERFPNLKIDREMDQILRADDSLVATMDIIRSITSSTLSLRKKHAIRVRQPLQTLEVVTSFPASELEKYAHILQTELNIKDVKFSNLKHVSKEDYGIVDVLNVNARQLGPRVGALVQHVIKASKQGNWHADGAQIAVTLDDGRVIALETGEYEIKTVIQGAENEVSRDAVLLPDGGFIVLDLGLTESLIHEGIVRDIIRDVQDARKNAGLDVADRIHLSLTLPADTIVAVEQFKELLTSETLTTDLDLRDGDEVKISVRKM
jgi:isoleucyl-tRNA synthetase